MRVYQFGDPESPTYRAIFREASPYRVICYCCPKPGMHRTPYEAARHGAEIACEQAAAEWVPYLPGDAA